MPAAPPVTSTRRPARPASKPVVRSAAVIFPRPLNAPLAQCDHRPKNHEPVKNRTRRVWEIAASKQGLQRRQEENATEHAEILAASAGDDSAADHDNCN